MSKFQAIIFTQDNTFKDYISNQLILKTTINFLGVANDERNFQNLLDTHENIDLVISDCREYVLDTATTLTKFLDNTQISSIIIHDDNSAKSSKIQELSEANMPADKQVSFNNIVTTIKKFFEDK